MYDEVSGKKIRSSHEAIFKDNITVIFIFAQFYRGKTSKGSNDGPMPKVLNFVDQDFQEW